MKSEEATKLPDFNKMVKVINAQADLKAVAWSHSHGWGISDVSLRKLDRHKKRVEENISRLCAWVARVRPEGDLLHVSRYMYRQYQKELERVDKSVLELAQLLDRRVK